MVEKTNATETTGKRTKESTGKNINEDGPQKLGGVHKFSKKPQFLKDRLDFFSRLYEGQV